MIFPLARAIKRKVIERTVQVKGGVKGGSVKVIGGLGLVWQTIISIYHGVCPLINFVDEDEIVEEE